jgi:hypothetical protein
MTPSVDIERPEVLDAVRSSGQRTSMKNEPLPTPHPGADRRFTAGNAVEKAGSRARSREQLAAAYRARAERRASWPSVRQPIADDREHLKTILRTHGLSHIPEAEPATPKRVAQLLRRAGFTSSAVQQAVGLKLEHYVRRNPDKALWWLVACAIEGTAGRTMKRVGGAR